MNTNWIKVFIGAFFEVFWVIGLKHAIISAGRKLPVGTVYAVFVGLGTAGTVLSGILFFGEPFKVEKIILTLLILAGVMGLKLVTKDEIQNGDES